MRIDWTALLIWTPPAALIIALTIACLDGAPALSGAGALIAISAVTHTNRHRARIAQDAVLTIATLMREMRTEVETRAVDASVDVLAFARQLRRGRPSARRSTG